MKGFKKCPVGHWYKGDLAKCPYCQGKGVSHGNITATISGDGNVGATQDIPEGDTNGGTKTEVIISNEKNSSKGFGRVANVENTKTVFVEIEEEIENGNVVVKKEIHSNKTLVGWLVTYSIDPLGIDYKIYAGRNEIGQDIDCNITVNDNTMSRKHATILYRHKKFLIEDNMSSGGTMVNHKDIGVRTAVELHDGAIIEMGETVFVFKTTGIEMDR